jgi:hypothetical protein
MNKGPKKELGIPEWYWDGKGKDALILVAVGPLVIALVLCMGASQNNFLGCIAFSVIAFGILLLIGGIIKIISGEE